MGTRSEVRCGGGPAGEGRDGTMPKAQIGSGLRTGPRAGLTGHMQDRVRRFRVFLKVLDGLRRGAHDELHTASLGLGPNLVPLPDLGARASR